MNEKPRVIIALTDRAESAILADWLASDGYEPYKDWRHKVAARMTQYRA